MGFGLGLGLALRYLSILIGAGGGGSFTPASLSPALWLAGGHYQDTARTTPTTTAGQQFRGWTDGGAGATHASSLSSQTSPVESAGLRGPQGDGVDDRLELSGAIAGTGAQTLWMRWRMVALPSGNAAVLVDLRGAGLDLVEIVQFGGYKWLSFNLGATIGTTPSMVGADVGNDTSWHYAVIQYDGSGSGTPGAYTLDFDGAPVTVQASGGGGRTTTDPSSLLATWYLGSLLQFASATLQEVGLVNRTLTSGERANLNAYLAGLP